jgi:hypothetical protein
MPALQGRINSKPSTYTTKIDTQVLTCRVRIQNRAVPGMRTLHKKTGAKHGTRPPELAAIHFGGDTLHGRKGP